MAIIHPAKGPANAVVLIHGIGDQKQGETLEKLVSSYFMRESGNGKPLHLNKSKLFLPESGENAASDHVIGKYTADLITIEQKPSYVFAEVYWADISRVAKGFWGFLAGLWQLMTGLRFIVEAAAGPQSDRGEATSGSARARRPLEGLVKWTGVFINAFLTGPLIATNSHLLILTIGAFLTTRNIFSVKGIVEEIVFSSLCAIFLFVFYVLYRKNYMMRTTFEILIFCFISIAVYIILSSYSSGFFEDNVSQYAKSIISIVSGFWTLLAGASLLLLVVGLIAYFRGYSAAPLSLAMAGPCLNIGIWALVVSTFWVLTRNTVLQTAENGEFAELGGAIIKSIPYLGLVWIATIVLGIALVIVMFLRNWHAARHREVPSAFGYRLIFSPIGVVIVLLGIAAWIAGTAIALAGYKFPTESWTLVVAPFVILFVGVLGALRNPIAQGLDLLLDIVTFFRREDRKLANGKVVGNESLYIRRDRIAQRFTNLINHLIEDYPDLENLTIVAHSQGTITAIMELERIESWWRGNERMGNSPNPNIQLVTMGSPYTHIYNHYYPDDFRMPNPKVANWVNIYSIDDYVGTEIVSDDVSKPLNINREKIFDISCQVDGGKLTGESEKTIEDESRHRKLNRLVQTSMLKEWCQKSAMAKPIGHNGYWTDALVMDFLRKLAPF
jgi:hypothetical protein